MPEQTRSEAVSRQHPSSLQELDFDVVRDLQGEDRYPDFLGMLSRVAVSPRDSMDAILVPAARPVSDRYAGRIANVARDTNTRLLTFVSHQADSGEMAALLDNKSVPEWWVVEVPDEGHELPFMKFESPDAIPDHARKNPPSNLGHIRNVGSVISKVIGWDRIIFSDDDVEYASASLRAVSLMLPGHKIAGMRCGIKLSGNSHYERPSVKGFADKDVIHHALDQILRIHSSPSVVHRPPNAGHISGNSIATNPQTSGLVFAPEIYNEDLIAFYDMYVEGSAALSPESEYYQTEYYPFADPERAKWEAFGELIQSGLYLPLWRGQTVDLTDSGHWDNTIARQIRKIETLLRGLNAPQKREYFGYLTVLPERDLVHEAAIRRSLLDALAMNRTFSGVMGADYLRAWNEDKATFRNCVAELPGGQSIADTLGWLGLSYRSNVAA